MTDVRQQISAVRRSVGSRVLEAGTARVSTISQVYNTDVDDLWDAVTSAERIPRWFLPISGDLQVGGRYQLEGNAGGTVERCDKPTGFAATWEYGGQVSWIEVRLSSLDDGRTRFELDHIAHVDDERWAEFGPGATGVGWDMGLLGLAGYIASDGTRVRPEDAMTWMVSEEARLFMTLSSNAWCDADIAAGAEPDAARAAADRTLAAYTATP